MEYSIQTSQSTGDLPKVYVCMSFLCAREDICLSPRETLWETQTHVLLRPPTCSTKRSNSSSSNHLAEHVFTCRETEGSTPTTHSFYYALRFVLQCVWAVVVAETVRIEEILKHTSLLGKNHSRDFCAKILRLPLSFSVASSRRPIELWIGDWRIVLYYFFLSLHIHHCFCFVDVALLTARPASTQLRHLLKNHREDD